MNLLRVLTGLLLLLGLNLSFAEDNQPLEQTLLGRITERRGDIKSVEAWNAPSDPYYVLETSKSQTLLLRPSESVKTEALRKWVGQNVIVTGYYHEGVRTTQPLSEIIEQTPIEPRWQRDAKGQIVASGWQALPRGSGFIVKTLNRAEPSIVTLEGTVLDDEWANADHRLALLTLDAAQHGKLVIIDAEQPANRQEIAIPDAYRPSCFAWLADDDGFLLAMAKQGTDDSAVQEEFYRYRFDQRQFEPVYQQIERQFVDVFNIAIDNDSDLWAVGSVGEGNSDVAVYQGEKTVLMTDVFPWSITPLRWQDHQLIVLSEAYLEFGLTGKSRDQHPDFDTRHYPERAWGNGVAYRIDPANQQARREEELTLPMLKVLLEQSFDQRYRSELNHQEQLTTLSIERLP